MTDRCLDVAVLTSTTSDGGCTDAWFFHEDPVRPGLRARVDAGIDTLEIGYLTTARVYQTGAVGPRRYCREDSLRSVAQQTKLKPPHHRAQQEP